MQLLAGVVGGYEMLPAVLDPFDRPAEPQGRGADQDIFRVELSPNTKPSAHVSLVEYNAVWCAPEHAGDLVAVPGVGP